MNQKLLSVGAALAGLVYAGAAGAQASHDPTTAQSGTYAVDPFHTQVIFNVDHLGFSKYYGEFSGVTGALTLDAKNPAASQVSITFPAASIYTPSDKLNEELKSKTALDAATYPTITFVSKSVTPTGPGTAKVAGELTLHGVTQPVVLDAVFHGVGKGMKKYTVGFDATAHIKRGDFGVKSWEPFVGDDVDIVISAAFEKTN